MSTTIDIGSTKSPQKIVKKWRKKRARARYRLLSIERDSDFVRCVVALHCARCAVDQRHDWPLVANQRCGSWYAHPLLSHESGNERNSCYFKSTDGHVGTWAFSLKRLNFHLLDILSSNGGCFVVDSSKTKITPDSLSRTIPIWCAVINCSVMRLARERSARLEPSIVSSWREAADDQFLFTPSDVISDEERKQISARIDGLAEDFIACGSIGVDWLLSRVKKPLRPYWICNTGDINSIELPDYDADSYNCIVCISCSNPSTSRSDVPWYSAGAADDHESWAQGLTPSMFWENRSNVLPERGSDGDTDRAINMLVQQAKKNDEEWYLQNGDPARDEHFSIIGRSGMAIGTRRAGRPPECWKRFDCVLNVTTLEYDGLASGDEVPRDKSYLCCPVPEGKRDKYELENWLAVAIVFVITNLVEGKRVLIQCAQGMDRSVAITMATAVLFCSMEEGEELSLLPWCQNEFCADGIAKRIELGVNLDAGEGSLSTMYKSSRMSQAHIDALMGRPGKKRLLSWVNNAIVDGKNNSSYSGTECLADKGRLRQVLHLNTRYHGRASPSRSTMQKLNRFFMSSEYEE